MEIRCPKCRKRLFNLKADGVIMRAKGRIALKTKCPGYLRQTKEKCGAIVVAIKETNCDKFKVAVV